MGRPVVESYYYSGQGRAILGDRDPTTGEALHLRGIGNATAVSVDVSSTKFEHKESMTGDRGADFVQHKDRVAAIKMTLESLSLDNLCLGLFGEVVDVAGAIVANEAHKIPAPKNGEMIALKYPNVSAVSIKTGADSAGATVVDPAAYEVDAGFGTIHIKDATEFTGPNVYAAYTYGASKRMDILTKPLPAEKFFRFEGLNTTNGDLVLVNASRVQLDPLPSQQLINEDFGSVELSGTCLLDPLITEGSKYITQTLITPA